MSNLFISHSSRDNEMARELQARLEGQGHHSLFLDLDTEKGIHAGESWERKLYTQLRSCRAVVALCSDHYLASHWCFAEIALARMEGKDLFALQIEPWSGGSELPSILTEDQYIDLRSDPESGYRQLWKGFEVKGIVPEEHRTWKPGEPPYPGLEPFGERHAPIFFGRDDEVRNGVELLNRVRRQGHPRMVMVLGSSGSGKSSLARAGIVPRLRGDKERWLVVGPFKPGRQPGREAALALTEALGQATKPPGWDELLAELERGAPGADRPAGPRPEPPAARRKLRQALLELEAEVAGGDPRLARSVSRLKEYLDRAADEVAGEQLDPDPREVAPRPPADPASGPAVAGARAEAADPGGRAGASAARPAGEEPAAGSRPAERRPSAAPGSGPLAALAAKLRLAHRAAEAKVVFVIDQFEELLGHEESAPGPDHPANRFLAVLRDAIESEDHPPLALGTMRSDFLGMLQRSGPLRGVGFKSLPVGPMSDKGMKEVIERPATLGQIQLEDGLSQRLLSDTGSADALPLLAFTLRAMWERYHEQRRFDLQGYEALGGLHSAIARVADDTLEAALADGYEGARKDLRIAFLSLARPAAEGTGWARQPVSLDEMPERARPMIRRFLDQRLLVRRKDGTVEVAHEALFRSWETLRGWLNANAEGLHLLREIAIDAEKWQQAESGEDKKDYLLGGGRLARAVELRGRGVLQLSELDASFIEASETEERRRLDEEEARRQAELEKERQLAAEQRRSAERAKALAATEARSARRMKAAAVVVGGLLVAALLALAYAVVKEREARDQTRVAVARNLLDTDPTRAALVLLELGDPERTAFATQLMSDALREPLALFELAGHGDQVTWAEYSPAGDRIVTASADGTARIWPLDAAGEPLPASEGGWQFVALEPVEKEPVLRAAFQPVSGGTLLTVSSSAVRLWNADGTPLLRADGSRRQVVLDPDGWDLVSAAFSPDGERILTASNQGRTGRARLWWANGEPLPAADGDGGPLVLDHGRVQLTDAAFGPGGELVVTSDRKKGAWLWRADGSGEPRRLPARDAGGERLFDGHAEALTSLAVSPSGETVATASYDDTARLWSLDGAPVTVGGRRDRPVEMAHRGDVYRVAWDRSGTRIVTASDDGTARLWSADGTPAESADGSRQIVLRHAAEINSAAFSPSGGRVVTAARDKTARVWPATGGSEPVVLEHRWATGARPDARGRILTTSAWAKPEPPRRTAEDYLSVTAWRPDGGDPPLPLHERIDRWSADPLEGVVFAGHPRGTRLHATVPSPSGDRYLTASADGAARLWDADGNAVERAGGGGPVVLCHGELQRGETVPASGGGTVGCGSEDGSGKPPINAAAFDPSGARIATASEDGTVRLWSGRGEPLLGARPPGNPIELHHGGGVTAVAFSPSDADLLLTASRDGKARLWDLSQPGAQPTILEHCVAGRCPEVTGAGFSRRGELLVTTAGFEVWLWRTDGSRVEREMRHDNPVLAASFSPTGDRIASGSKDFTARVWSTDGRGEPLVLRTKDSFQASAAFVGEAGDRLVTVALYKAGQLWRLSPQLLGAKIRAVTSLCLDPEFRIETLRESPRAARRRSARCERCLQTFRAAAAASGPDRAFESYTGCAG